MEQRLTARAKRMLTFARREAEKSGTSEIQPLHLFLAMLRFDRSWKYPNNAVLILRRRGILTDTIRQSVEAILKRNAIQSSSPNASLRFDERIQHILIRAGEEMQLLDDKNIGVEHLLLGLIPEAGISELLSGLSLEAVREEVRALRS